MSIAGMFDFFPTRCRQNYNFNQIQIMVHSALRNTAGAPFSVNLCASLGNSLGAPPLKPFPACQHGKRCQDPETQHWPTWIQRTPALQCDVLAYHSAALVALEIKEPAALQATIHHTS